MSKKLLAMFLAIVMVLGAMPVLALISSAEEVEVKGTVTRGDNGENCTDLVTDGLIAGAGGNYVDIGWASQTFNWTYDDGVLTVGGYSIGKFDAKEKDYPWHDLREEVTKVIVLPGTKIIGQCAFSHMTALEEAYVGEGVEELYNDCFGYNGDDRVILHLPSTIKKIYQGVCYLGRPAKIVLNGITKARIDSIVGTTAYTNLLSTDVSDIVETNFTSIEVTPWNDGFENWEGSSNKGDDPAVTQLLVVIKDMNGATFAPEGDYTWEVTILRGQPAGEKTVTGAIAKTLTFKGPDSVYSPGALNRFEICLGEGENQFVPQKGAKYTVSVQVYDADGNLAYSGISAEGAFNCKIDPIVREKTYTPQFANPNCYLESDLGAPVALCKVAVGNYVGSRYYQWEVYASNDNTLPIDQWTLIGEKKDEVAASETPDAVNMQLNAENAYDEYRYIRVYGTYDSANIGYHFSELRTYAYVGGNSHVITFVTAAGQTTALTEDGQSPVYTGSTEKTPDYTVEYEFAGWTDGTNTYDVGEDLPAATADAIYTAVYKTSPRSARIITLDGWGNMENWNWGGVEKQTQLLIQVNSNDPTFASDVEILSSHNYGDVRWVFTFDYEIDGEAKREVHTMTPWSTIAGPNTFRFRVVSGYDAFIPLRNVDYTINVDIYDMTLTEEYGPEGYLLYTTDGKSTRTYALNDDAMYDDEYVEDNEFCTITWEVEGETVGTTKVLRSVTPQYTGTPLAATKIVDGDEYILVTPTITPATGAATYSFSYKKVGAITVKWVDEAHPENNYEVESVSGRTVTYEGSAESYTEGYYRYDVVIPGDGEVATVDTTYYITYTQVDTRKLGIGTYQQFGWENWPNNDNKQTQLLVVLSKEGKDFNIEDRIDAYTWELTIDDETFITYPTSSTGLWGTGYLYRFTPCNTDGTTYFVPEAGASYNVSVKLYDKETGELAYYTDGAVKTTVPADFEPVIPKPVYEKGDVDGNGVVNISDVTALLDYLSASEEEQAEMIAKGTVKKETVNVNGDDIIAISDVTVLLDIISNAEA